jgi:hypothetical protein
VYVEDPTDTYGQPRGKQVLQPGGIWYTATSGIWQTVWLEPVTPVYIDSLQITPDIDANVLRLKVNAGGNTQTGQYTIKAIASENGNEVGTAQAAANTEFEIPIPNPHLWSPDDPFLYDLQITLMDGDKPVDTITSYFGMRKISLGKITMGTMGDIPHILLNNQFVFQLGPLDQGFWPEGIYTAPTDEAMKFDLEFAKQIGWNMIRKHIKVEPDRWYYWADKLGLIVWQDMPSPDSDNLFSITASDFEAELGAMIEGRRNHPSIVLWVVFNEGWGQEQFGAAGTERFTQLVRELDPSRLVTNASGWTDYKVGDTFDVHTYVGPSPILPEKERATVQGEFGGLGLHMPGHEWSDQSFAYEWQDNSAFLTARYTGLIDQARLQMLDFGLSAAVYTEITDVEQELNGFITYDREVVKVDVDAVYAANQKLIDQSKLIQ